MIMMHNIMHNMMHYYRLTLKTRFNTIELITILNTMKSVIYTNITHGDEHI